MVGSYGFNLIFILNSKIKNVVLGCIFLYLLYIPIMLNLRVNPQNASNDPSKVSRHFP